MSLAIVCPSLGRPVSLNSMIVSVLKTAPHVYVATSDAVGRGSAINSLCDENRSHRAYLLVSDDVEFVRPGWDRDILSAMDSFGDDIGVVHLKDGMQNGNVSWPCVSRKWIDAVGWFNPPRLKHYCQDTAIQAMGEALGRIKAVEEIALRHDCMSSDNGNYGPDVQGFLEFMAYDFGPALNRLRAAMS